MHRALSLIPLLLLSACAARDRITIVADAELAPLLEEFAAPIPWPDLVVETAADPVAAAEKGRGFRVAVVADPDCAECYRIEGEGRVYTVRGGAPLGVQYGLADWFERMGFRFLHPHETFAPTTLAALDPAPDGTEEAPELRRRGIHLHTLHPTDALFDFWVPGEENRARAEAVLDWLVKNRANHVQWMGLDDIADGGADWTAWHEHTAALLETAHRRGLTAGLGVELYGTANLQHAYDLVDNPSNPESDRASIEERLALVLGDLPWDLVNLSFGEFFGEDPEAFVTAVDDAYAVLQAEAPGTEMAAWIHIGDDVRVEWEGEDLIYYFLVRETDPAIVRSVHTVMYFDLFDPAVGAYHHEDFAEHREFLLERLRVGEPVQYYPETAYWVAFDLPVPVFLPIYVRSRWTDLHGLREATAAEGLPPLDDHVTFSTGWEWGYWLHDVAVLRMNWSIPEDFREPLAHVFAAWGALGAEVADIVGDLAETQHDALIEAGLSPWYSSRDNIMEAGYLLDIVSQPARPGFDEILELPAADRETLEQTVLRDLAAFRDALQDLEARWSTLAVPEGDRWLEEIGDGIEVDAARAAFMTALLGAVLDHARGEDPEGALENAERFMADARTVVDRRHARLHDPDPERLLEEGRNPTLYQYGYLIRAEELCFWERELAQVKNAVAGLDEDVPGCGL